MNTHGELLLDGTQVGLNQSISKLDIEQGLFTYQADLNAYGQAYDSFSFKVSDGENESLAPVTLTLNVNEINDASIVTGETNYSVNTGESVSGAFSVTDVDGMTDGSYFTIEGTPAIGTVSINPETGAWVYTAEGSGVDSFVVKITDDLGHTQLQEITLEVLSAVEKTPQTETDETDLEQEQEVVEEQIVVEELLPTENLEGTTADLSEMIAAMQALEPVDLIKVINEAIEAVDSEDEQYYLKQQVANIEVDREVRDIASYRIDSFEPLSLKSLEAASVDTILDSKDFQMELERIRADIDSAFNEDTKLSDLQVEAAAGAGVSLTAGFVAWALRSGSLLASFFTVMPVWRNFDPMPILSSSDKPAENAGENSENPAQKQTTKAEKMFD